jgi:hypothetical protein
MSEGPWTFERSREAGRQASAAQHAAEKFIKDAAKQFAHAEERYRVALAEEILRLHEQGVAWSSTSDLARGAKHVAELKRKRDIEHGVLEAAKQAAWRRSADREDTQRFTDWSMRRELAEGYGRSPEPAVTTSVIGGRAA